MIVYPAIDLRRGRCVRLAQGRADRERVYAKDPAAVARTWEEQGARWLHVVNLDGALGDESAANLAALARILEAVDAAVQFGGGLRTLADVRRVLDMGVTRAVLGTVAVRDPGMVAEALERFGSERIVVGIDASHGLVATHGWRQMSDMAALDLAREMESLGVDRVVYTDIQRDGMLGGVNVEATRRLAEATSLSVIASGGVGSLDDVRALASIGKGRVEGVIVGMALYEGRFSLSEAIAVANAAEGA
ncbi:MAG: 1-(5-phosphoribosyl)-5-[(5-phosphoribosylamino)methylideneamino]imidazole-4-carboxamide isomerase [Anaerolineae bacterium]